MKAKILILVLFGMIFSATTQTFSSTDFYVWDSNPVVINTRAVVLADSGYVNTNVMLDHANSFSWFAWINTTSSYPYGYLMSSYRIDGDPYCRMQMRSSGIIRVYFNFGGGAVSLDSPISVNDGEDHFVGLVANRTDGYMTIWIDGEPVSSVVIPPGNTNSMNPNAVFCIGTKATYQNYSFKGLIDDVQVYDGNVTGQNIVDLYNGGDMTRCGDPRYIRGDILVGWWRFNEQTRTQTIDEVSGAVGTFFNNVTWVEVAE